MSLSRLLLRICFVRSPISPLTNVYASLRNHVVIRRDKLVILIHRDPLDTDNDDRRLAFFPFRIVENDNVRVSRIHTIVTRSMLCVREQAVEFFVFLYK